MFVDNVNLVSEWIDHAEIARKTSQDWRVDGWEFEEVLFSELPLSRGGPMDHIHVVPEVLDLSEALATLHTDHVLLARLQFSLISLELPE